MIFDTRMQNPEMINAKQMTAINVRRGLSDIWV